MVATTRFVRRTFLHANEYHTNFRKIDSEVITLLTSDVAADVTSHMCKIYLTLVNAEPDLLEREGVLRFTGCLSGGRWMTAWEQLVAHLKVASATARKALLWMSEQGVIGYYAGRNGVGIRIFINRAVSSIGHRARAAQKNLQLARTSCGAALTSPNDVPFNDSFAVIDNLDLIPRAPENGAEINRVAQTSSRPAIPPPEKSELATPPAKSETRCLEAASPPGRTSLNDLVALLKHELEPALRMATVQAARLEHERTREWLDKHGIPKATRVAQREAYTVLRNHGVLAAPGRRDQFAVDVGHGGGDGGGHIRPPKPLTEVEIRELAEMCVAMMEVHGQAIEATILEIGADAGGWLLSEDAPRVRMLAESMAAGGAAGGGKESENERESGQGISTACSAR